MVEQWLTAEQVAEILQVHRKTVYVWLREGKIPAGKFGRSWRIRRQDLEAFVKANGGKEG